ncbi:hypothetical protein SH467x_000374 [Pirellulaceae bacterium SH467]
MKSNTAPSVCDTNVAARIAGEDLRKGDFVTALIEMIELPSFLWCCDSTASPKDELIRLRYLPVDAGEPFKVLAVCLPFVYTKRASGKLRTLDTRRHQLVRLDKRSGKKIWKRMRGNA